MVPSPDSLPECLWVIVNARGSIVADLGDGTPLQRTEAEEGAAYLDVSEPDYLTPHRVRPYRLAVMPDGTQGA